MGPKKDGKKQAISKPDNSGIAKQDIQFSITLDVVCTDEPAQCVIMFEWFSLTSDKMQRFQTGLIETWSKNQNVYTFSKNMDPLHIDDDFCKTITNKRFFLYFVNAQDSKINDSILLDYSSLLMGKGDTPQQFQFQSSTIKVMNIDKFTLKLKSDKQLLGDVYRHYLNPFEVHVIGAKDTPIDKNSKYEPAYVKYTFFDGNIVQTNGIVGDGKLIWNHKHVFLIGLINPIQLKQKIRSKYIRFEFHDQDQIQNKNIKQQIQLFDIKTAIQLEIEKQKPLQQQDTKKKGIKKQEKKQIKKDIKKDIKKKDIKINQPILPQKIQIYKNNYGIAAFFLGEFLKSSIKNCKYKSPVVPSNTFQDFQSKNINLNTTARNQIQKIISSNHYFDKDTALIVGFTLSNQIGTFVKSKQSIQEVPKKKDNKGVSDIDKIEEKQNIFELKKDVFERIVCIIPYEDKQCLKKIEDLFYQVNMKSFKLNNKRQLTTYLLNKDQKESLQLNYVSAIEMIDPQGRLFIIQGLKEGAMVNFKNILEKNAPNTPNYKILRNSSISFSNRLYAEFNIQIKRIRFRPSLAQILLQPSIYIKSKVPQDICKCLNNISSIYKICDDLINVESMNLWPDFECLIKIQRKYSQSLSYEDIHGETQKKKNSKQKRLNDTNIQTMKDIKFISDQTLKYVTTDQFFLPPLKTQEIIQNKNQSDLAHTYHKHITTKIFNKDQSKRKQIYQLKLKKSQFNDDQQIYTYAGQKNNWYAKKMNELRQKIAENPNNIFTYSKQFLSQSIDPRDLDEEAKQQKLLQTTKNYGKQVFNSVTKRTYDERMKLQKKPGEEDINDLKNYPYHEQKIRQIQLKKGTRDQPLNTNKAQFQKYIRKPEYFSQPSVIQNQKISSIERQRQEKEQKKRLNQQNHKKLLGQPIIKIKKGYYDSKVIGIDKYKNIRQGQPIKKGIIDKNKKTKKQRPIQEYQVSLFLKEDFSNPSFNPLVRQDKPSLNVGNAQFNNYQRLQVLTASMVHKPLKQI